MIKLTENICLESAHGSIPITWLTVSHSCHNDVMIIYPSDDLCQGTAITFQCAINSEHTKTSPVSDETGVLQIVIVFKSFF